MLDTQKYLELVRKRGKDEKELSRVYRGVRHKGLFLKAYANLYANDGALTPGIDPNDTVDGMSLKRIDKIIRKLEEGTIKWKPVRRAYIEKKQSSKKRPLGIPGWQDKLLQEVLRIVLEAYYEPQFSDSSHGFRPHRGCHTVLTPNIKKRFTARPGCIGNDVGISVKLEWLEGKHRTIDADGVRHIKFRNMAKIPCAVISYHTARKGRAWQPEHQAKK